MFERLCTSLADTHAVAAALAGVARSGDVIVLSGEMGAGKTAFAQGFATALGVDEPVTSPTFTLVHTYATNGAPTGPLHHADVYRLRTMREVADLALLELVEAGGVLLVEWGDVISAALGDHLDVHLAFDADDAVETHRRISLTPHGAGWARRWSDVVAAVDKAGGVAP